MLPLFSIRKSFGNLVQFSTLSSGYFQRLLHCKITVNILAYSIVCLFLNTGSATDEIPVYFTMEFPIGVASVCSVCFLFGIGMLYW